MNEALSGEVEKLLRAKEEAAGIPAPEPEEDENTPQQAESDAPETEDSEADLVEALSLEEGDEEEGAPAQAGDLADIAKALGLDTEDLSRDAGGVLTVRTKVDGVESRVPLSELRKGYQLQSHFTRQQDAFLKERQQWEEARQAREQQIVQQSVIAAQILDGQEAELKAAYTRDWNALRHEDPAEYAAQVAEYNQKLQRIREQRNSVVGEIQRKAQEIQQQQQAYLAQRFYAERDALVRSLKWDDPKITPEKRNQHWGSLVDYLTKTNGFTEQELASVLDHRAYVLADKARKYDELVARSQVAKKRITETPAVPSAKSSPSTVSQSSRNEKRLAELEKRALQTGKQADQLAAARAIIGL
jgi:hypothetical protein